MTVGAGGNLGAQSRSHDGRHELLIRTQKDLLSSVSHELCSPLTRINLSLSLLKKELLRGS